MPNNQEFKNCYFKIKPSDTLFFRDGYTFKKKVNNHLESLDTPYPSVFYGAIFSALLRQGKFSNIINDIKDRNKDIINNKSEENFRIESIYIYDEMENEVYMKAPLDLFENDFNVTLGKYEDGYLYNPYHENYKYERADNKYISLSDLIQYYSKSDVKNITLYSREYFFRTYKKIGIEIDRNNRTAKDEHLYRLNMVEFTDKRFSYLVRCKINKNEGDIQPDVLKLGGESKLASFTYTDKSIGIIESLDKFYEEKKIYNDKLKIIFTTPMNEKNYQYIKENFKIKYTITGKPEYIGGFDMAKGEQKPMKKAVPSGSILVIENGEFEDKTISEILKLDKLKEIMSLENYFRGFGQVIIMPFKEE